VTRKQAQPRENIAPAKKQAIDAPRKTTFMLRPERITIIGRGSLADSKYTSPLDTTDGPEHPLFDPRALDEPDAELAEGMFGPTGQGQIQPITVTKEGERYLLAAGRGRTLAGRLWNVVHSDEEPVELECKLSRGKSATELLELVIAENEHRREVPVVLKAKMAQRLLDRGRSFEHVASLYRVSVQTLQTWLPALDMSQALQDAQASGERSKYEADKVAHLSHADQDAALELARETGARLGDVVEPPLPTTTRRRGSSHEPSTKPGAAKMIEVLKDAKLPDDLPWRGVLAWAAGIGAFPDAAASEG
jgi:ParB-like chromosome segregation protein Spo0J